MNIYEQFPRNYMKAADFQGLNGGAKRATIEKVLIEDVTEHDTKTTKPRPVMYFRGWSDVLVLNITNAKAMAEALGDETEEWVGRTVELYIEPNTGMGPGIRLRVAPPQDAPAVADEVHDNIPF